MSISEIALAILVTILIVIVFVSLSLGYISAKLSGIMMLVFPFVFNFLIVLFWEKGSLISATCGGILLSLAFGPATFVFGRILEKKVKEKRDIKNSDK